MSKKNLDPRCKKKRSCRAVGDGVCRGCSIAAISKALHKDPTFRARNHAATSAAVKKMHADPEYQKRQRAWTSETAKRLNADPEFKAQARGRARKLGQSKRAHSRGRKTVLKRIKTDPEFAARLKDQCVVNLLSQEAARKRRETALKNGTWLSESDQKAIAREVRYSPLSLKVIGEKWKRSGHQISTIAAKLGVTRGQHPGALTPVDKQDICDEIRKMITVREKAKEPWTATEVLATVAKNWNHSYGYIEKIAAVGKLTPLSRKTCFIRTSKPLTETATIAIAGIHQKVLPC